MKKVWNATEIEYIKEAYAQGKREKLIAHELGRTESSVSKAITRYKIRTKRDYSILSRQSTSKASAGRKVKPTKVVRPQMTFNGTACNWTSADEVLRYLGEKSSQFEIRYRNFTPVYIFQNREVSLAKVLMEANKIRLEENQPIFHLEEVTE
ncbi:hypothetical protein [Candidatus Odyssella thessalonicensis]|uniref:hypothetical protein n=1 Tax=Candidatus Odyssella thessalonicensis TaxID=84647 RepID=UPI000225ACBF|nr:hypothetical protein [Candidatus Odyssella thessalonicensis]